jgi:hypothetical protein
VVISLKNRKQTTGSPEPRHVKPPYPRNEKPLSDKEF